MKAPSLRGQKQLLPGSAFHVWPSGIGHAGGWWGGAVSVLLKSQGDGNLNKRAGFQANFPFCVWNEPFEGFQKYIVFNFSSSYLYKGGLKHGPRTNHIFVFRPSPGLNMYIHIPSGPFLDDHASRIKEDWFFDQNSKFWMSSPWQVTEISKWYSSNALVDIDPLSHPLFIWWVKSLAPPDPFVCHL